LDSTASSAPSAALKTGARAAAEGAVLAAAAALVATRFGEGTAQRLGVEIGAFAAWASSSASVAWLIWARGRSWKSFWWAFGGGMALRAATLAVLAVWGYRREPASLNALLVTYVIVLIALLLTLESRHLRLK
jgi:hypothetical protein